MEEEKDHLRKVEEDELETLKRTPTSSEKKEEKQKIEGPVEKKEFLEEDDDDSCPSKKGRKRKMGNTSLVKEEEKPKKSLFSSYDSKLKMRIDQSDESKLLIEKLDELKPIKKEVKDEYEFDDDASRDSTDVKDFLLRSERRKPMMSESIASPVVSESTPSSPASVNYGDDPDSEKFHRQWKKSISFLWNEIASHKNASIFLKPISEEKVPGYQSVVFRPMDLQTIKRNIENGLTRSTSDFHRDVMLMFLNAKIYNTDQHICRMSHEMLKDSLDIIEEFMIAQNPPKFIETPQKHFRRETRESSAKRVEEKKREDKPVKRRKIGLAIT